MLALAVSECQFPEDPVPTYQYACTACDHRFEAVQSFSDDALSVCPECGGKLRKVFSSVGIVFKGSGFYRTDSRAGAVPSGSSSSDSSGGSSDGGASSKSESKSSSSSTSSSDTKSASTSSSPAAAAS
jgi:putative FmdB family regulatory protein